MGRPHKGDRVPILVRVPRQVVVDIDRLEVVDRNAWIVRALERELQHE